MGVQQHLHLRRGGVEGCFQNEVQTLSAQGDVLRDE